MKTTTFALFIIFGELLRMSTAKTSLTIGHGAPELEFSDTELIAILTEGLAAIPAGARVIAILPDKTRDDNTHILFPAAAKYLASKSVAAFDALVAQGTHVPMTEAEKLTKVGMPNGLENCGNIFDHEWDSPEALIKLGELSAERVTQIRHLMETLDLLYGAFSERRLGGQWTKELAKMKKWLRGGPSDASIV